MSSASEELRTPRLEEFGSRPITPEERLAEYKEQCKGMPTAIRARFWIGVLQHDAQVRALVKVDSKEEHTWKRQRRR